MDKGKRTRIKRARERKKARQTRYRTFWLFHGKDSPVKLMGFDNITEALNASLKKGEKIPKGTFFCEMQKDKEGNWLPIPYTGCVLTRNFIKGETFNVPEDERTMAHSAYHKDGGGQLQRTHPPIPMRVKIRTITRVETEKYFNVQQ